MEYFWSRWYLLPGMFFIALAEAAAAVAPVAAADAHRLTVNAPAIKWLETVRRRLKACTIK